MTNLFLNNKVVPRWVILLIDMIICSWSFALSYFIIKQFEFTDILRGHFFIYVGLYSLISIVVFYCMRIHTGLIRYSNIQDIVRIFTAVLICTLIYPMAVELIVVGVFNISSLQIPKVLLINFFIATSFLIMLRSSVKGTFHYIKHVSKTDKEHVLVFGSDSSAILIKKALEINNNESIVVEGFIDVNSSKVNSYIEQKKVYQQNDLRMLKEKLKVAKLIVINEQLPSLDKNDVLEQCLALGIKVVTVPPSEQWVYGKLNLGQMKDLRIEDLLSRDPIVTNNNQISIELFKKRVLVTGAAGSIGSEIVRQVLNYQPAMIILCDQAESSLYDLQLELEERFPDADIRISLVNIQNFNSIQVIFSEHRPQIIFHAAAYKHVPMMEAHPTEAIRTNVIGTKNVADLAMFFGAEKFVMVSSDKAVNPTNVMGTSKRIAEMYVQSLRSVFGNLLTQSIESNPNATYINAGIVGTKFITTRFGNVLGSNGSVIPRFRTQIERGGPLTITHPDITRYFMTIPEAVNLVLEAAAMGKGSEIFVFDMGQPVRIVDLALKMIKLAGLTPHHDIKIVYTGLRPGEKLFEELLNELENTVPTHHDKIKIAKIRPYPLEKVRRGIQELQILCDQEDNFGAVRKMKEIVPEFKSKNSQYELLDNFQAAEKEVKFSVASGS